VRFRSSFSWGFAWLGKVPTVVCLKTFKLTSTASAVLSSLKRRKNGLRAEIQGELMSRIMLQTVAPTARQKPKLHEPFNE
jgi:hypothetical protein